MAGKEFPCLSKRQWTMGQIILATYSGLAIAAAMGLILGLSSLYKSYINDNFNSTFWFSSGICLLASGQAVHRTWASIWKTRYLAKEQSSWMLDHWIIPACALVMICGWLCIIKALTEDSIHGRMWALCAGIIIFVMFLTWVKM